MFASYEIIIIIKSLSLYKTIELYLESVSGRSLSFFYHEAKAFTGDNLLFY